MDANLGPSMRRLGKELQTDSSFLVSQVRKPPERGWQATEEECRRSLTKSKAFSLPGSRLLAPASSSTTPQVALVHSCFDVDVVEQYRQKGGPDLAA